MEYCKLENISSSVPMVVLLSPLQSHQAKLQQQEHLHGINCVMPMSIYKIFDCQKLTLDLQTLYSIT